MSYVKPCQKAVLLWRYLYVKEPPDRVVEILCRHAPNARLVKTSMSHVDEDKLRDLIKKTAEQAKTLRLT